MPEPRSGVSHPSAPSLRGHLTRGMAGTGPVTPLVPKTWVGVPIAVFPGCALLRGLLCMSAQATLSSVVSVTGQTCRAAGVLSAPDAPSLGTLRAESDLRSPRPRPRAARHDT